MTRNLSISFVLAVFLTACTTQKMTPTTIPVVQQPIPREVRIQSLLDDAKIAFIDKRLTTPVPDNAYERYLQVLGLDPENAAATNGINAIVEEYLFWAIERSQQGLNSSARHFLAKAQSIDPGHPNIDPVMKSIAEAQSKKTIRFDLDASAVRMQRVADINFHDIAKRIATENAFVTIRAPSDELGRWLYNELNKLVSVRIEARFEISRQTSISLTR